jgi:hypothetical protein
LAKSEIHGLATVRSVASESSSIQFGGAFPNPLKSRHPG